MIVNKFHTPRSGTGEVAFVGNQRQRNRSYPDGHRANSLSRHDVEPQSKSMKEANKDKLQRLTFKV